ncbi:MAG: serine hydrolase domain-containing protein [bacterium]
MKNYISIILLIILTSCTPKEAEKDVSAEQFRQELLELKEYFSIPGLAVSIEKNGETSFKGYYGVSDAATATAVDSTTLFPIASITKVFSSVLIMKLVEEKKLSLETPINTFFPEPILNDSILVKHVLSHTSQGAIGEEFYYSSRFGLLTKVIEQASGKPFAEVMENEMFKPLQLKNTFLLKDSTQIKRVAKPYVLDNGIENGFIDYGYSSSAGIVSNLEDLATFNNALDDNTLINEASKKLLFTSFKPELPYGYGIFNQQFENLNIVWAYGQYDCYSSLLLKIPAENITLTLLANNSLMSDPARLINGDVTSSLFALSFLKNYVLDLNEISLFENLDSFSTTDTHSEFYRKKLLSQALAESYMARYDPEKLKTSATLIHHLFDQYPDYEAYADLNLLHTLSFLKDVAFYMELDEFTDFDVQLERIASLLLEKEPNNPYAHIYLGTFHARKDQSEKARFHFEHIVNAKNFSKNWYTNEAQQWLNDN